MRLIFLNKYDNPYKQFIFLFIFISVIWCLFKHYAYSIRIQAALRFLPLSTH